ncbi:TRANSMEMBRANE PROTEIN [Salix viminalis]|uniref:TRANSMEMBRANE PROTEIN n=1 Tax=Salix viminalis TaxID=40686 RepID=A0A9Q0NSI0_SALVM|nr:TRANSMEMBRANE PROTEIN [Salix viminalis]
MNSQLFRRNLEFRAEWPSEDVQEMFFKCVRWQVEDTVDPINCPYHYYCDSTYPGNHPPYVDVLVFLFTAALYLATLAIMVVDISRRGRTCLSKSKIYLQPSGPVSLPLILLVLAKGYRINTVFPLSCIGPAILQLLQVSALTFDSGGSGKDVRYAIFQASTISGILHASLYLDSIILPYYTGFDALVSSTFSGECASCVCRKEALVVGGRLIRYRGWSLTTFLVIGALCLRILCRVTGESKSRIMSIKSLLESLGLILITVDCVYLIRKSPEQSLMRIAAFGGVLVLICLQMIKRMSAQMIQWHSARVKLETGRICTLQLGLDSPRF